MKEVTITETAMNKTVPEVLQGKYSELISQHMAVEYGDTGNDYGNYTLGDSKIMLSENLLGGGREGSAKLASVMSHEGTHYYGNRVEALAHMSAAETYSQLNQKFKLQADTSFSMEMLAGIMNTDNWKENTGDVDHWTLMDDGSLAYDGKANLYDENGNLIYKTDSQGIQGSLKEILGLENQTEAYNLMIQAGMEWDGKSWKNSSNPTDGSLAIKMDMTTGENGTGRTYKELYETRELTDSLTGYTATLEQHNPVNIYNMMVSCGFGPVIYDYSAITMSNGEWNGRLPVRQLSYEEWKANNYIDNPSLAMIMLGKPLEDDSKVTSDFGMRKDPFGSDKKLFHTGTDFSALEGTPIYPMQDGYVFFLDFTEYGGNTVILQHNLTYDYKNFTISSNYYTNYLHLKNNSNGKPNTNFNLGEFVTANQVLGYTGNTGPSTGPHLHAGIYFDSIQSNPYANWLYMDNYADNNRLSNNPFNNYYSNINYFREQGRW